MWSSLSVQHQGYDTIDIQDVTPPVVAIYLGRAPGAHNISIDGAILYANLWNKEYQTSVSQCQINWGEGVGWETVGIGTSATWYSLSHTYSSTGEKRVDYRCQNSLGLWSSGNTQHANYDLLTLNGPINPPQPPGNIA